MTLNLFYEEPDPDRWVPLDRYPRRVVRRIVRGRLRPGGQMRVFLNLCAGLDRLGVRYRVNDYRYIKSHPDELACIIGKPHVLNRMKWKNPILFGAAVYSHPTDDPGLLARLPIRRVVVPGEWMRGMCEPYWGDKVVAWPVGIDTEHWSPTPADEDRTIGAAAQGERGPAIDCLVYDKVRWQHERYERDLIAPVRSELERRGLSIAEIRYGFYKEEDFHRLLRECRTMIFLCEHETQGIAYQQALSCGVPILAWDRGGYWQDPAYFPHKVRFGPVSSVPYWDDRCGETFQDASAFPAQFEKFRVRVLAGRYSPRDYILENLTLEKCARKYVELACATVNAARHT